ncbi:MAG: HPr family phosphocarrier protein [Lentisphaeria bacterium]|jgi:phosphocarrier protein|nr:HPr family phosphocarrier protein [Lentisphaeria bacterium]MDP7743808.1 HPr family phosphocarrier protein [Lentisphaeria bacterium]
MAAKTINKAFIMPNKLGMHLRAAVLFAKTASRFKADIEVRKDDEVSDGKSNLGLMMLAAMEGDTIRVRVNGDDAPAAMNAIANLFDRLFDEE